MQKILIFDGEEDILEVVQLMFKNEFEVHTRSFLEDPVETAKSVDPDIILIDLYIPSMGGAKAVKILKSDENTKDIKVILFSTSKKVKEISKELGADGYIMKPFKIADVRQFLREQIEN